MAHRTNVVSVLEKVEPKGEAQSMVMDPVCGTNMKRQESKYMLFRQEETYYFCSKDCQSKFASGRFKAATKVGKAA